MYHMASKCQSNNLQIFKKNYMTYNNYKHVKYRPKLFQHAHAFSAGKLKNKLLKVKQHNKNKKRSG